MDHPTEAPSTAHIDGMLPPEMAVKAAQLGVKKANMPAATTFILACLAGAFIALGAVFATTATSGATELLPYGVVKTLGGVVFSLGLILVIVAGAELFTGNNLIVMAVAQGDVSLKQLIRNWGIVYLGNFAGSLTIALLMFMAGQYKSGNGAVGLNILNIANSKCNLEFFPAVASGIVCNILVCLAVWLCFSARSVSDKILCIIFPISAFVAAGTEHCVANMYFVPIAWFVKNFAGPDFWQSIQSSSSDYSSITWTHFMTGNLLPVTIGNLIGGSLMVGLVFWFVYLRKQPPDPGRN